MTARTLTVLFAAFATAAPALACEDAKDAALFINPTEQISTEATRRLAEANDPKPAEQTAESAAEE